MSSKIYNVLVLCTENSARSILAEAIINREGAGKFRGFSAGSQPKDEPNPVALEFLQSLGYNTAYQRSKSWTEFSGPDAPDMDIIITVCDSVAGEECPYWPGHPLVAHWGMADPANVEGTHEEKLAAFRETYNLLMMRVKALFDLPVAGMQHDELKSRLMDIGKKAEANGKPA